MRVKLKRTYLYTVAAKMMSILEGVADTPNASLRAVRGAGPHACRKAGRRASCIGPDTRAGEGQVRLPGVIWRWVERCGYAVGCGKVGSASGTYAFPIASSPPATVLRQVTVGLGSGSRFSRLVSPARARHMVCQHVHAGEWRRAGGAGQGAGRGTPLPPERGGERR